MEFWKEDMRLHSYDITMISTQASKNAQGFYRRLGYRDCSCLVPNVSGYEQPPWLFMSKALYRSKKSQ